MLLAVVYATLAGIGNALHQHSPTVSADNEASHSCGNCCCLHELLGAKPKATGEFGFSAPQESPAGEHCLACRVLTQMKLGHASLPPAVSLTVLNCEREAVIEIADLSRTNLRIATRGPPVALPTVA